MLIAKPGISVSTKFVYENLNVPALKFHPDIDGIIEAIREQDLKGVSSLLSNVLERVTIKEYPVIEDIKNFMKEHGALNAIMSGSGPTVFGLFGEERTAQRACQDLKNKGLAKQVYLTDIYNRRDV